MGFPGGEWGGGIESSKRHQWDSKEAGYMVQIRGNQADRQNIDYKSIE